MTYAEKLKDPRWQRKRLEILERDGWQCRTCGDSDSTLHVHHRYYVKGREPWDYLPFALVTLCEGCHSGFPSNDEGDFFKWEKFLEAFSCAGSDAIAHRLNRLVDALNEYIKQPGEKEDKIAKVCNAVLDKILEEISFQ